jgi:membrane protein implicated in regulation of membrane protease activity
VLINALIPMIAGGAFIAGLLYNNLEAMVAPVCLIFYGLALVNASKYTLSDIRYLGIAEIILGILNVFYLRRGLYFWAVGFGVLHILYGAIMWWKYERQSA